MKTDKRMKTDKTVFDYCVVCPICGSYRLARRHIKNENEKHRFRCLSCGKYGTMKSWYLTNG